MCIVCRCVCLCYTVTHLKFHYLVFQLFCLKQLQCFLSVGFSLSSSWDSLDFTTSWVMTLTLTNADLSACQKVFIYQILMWALINKVLPTQYKAELHKLFPSLFYGGQSLSTNANLWNRQNEINFFISHFLWASWKSPGFTVSCLACQSMVRAYISVAWGHWCRHLLKFVDSCHNWPLQPGWN